MFTEEHKKQNEKNTIVDYSVTIVVFIYFQKGQLSSL